MKRWPGVLCCWVCFGLAACGDDDDSDPPASDAPVAQVDAASDAPPVGPADLGSVLDPFRTAAGLPAIAGAVTTRDELLALGAAGVRKAGDPTAVTANDKFHLGSCTKAMTAALAAQLVEEGALSWDATLPELLPDITDMDPAFANVTLIELFSHRAGIDDTAHDDLWGALWASTDPVPEQRRWFADELLARAPATTPGSAFAYSNFGYMVAGRALERLTGSSWEELMQERIFTPLGMSSCGFGAPATPGQIDQPWGHTTGGQPVEPGPGADNPPALGPAGTVHCALADWARFAAVFIDGREGFLSADSVALLTTPVGDEYALGWGVGDREWAGGPALNHAGSNTMFLAIVWIAPARDRAFLVASNIASDGAFAALDTAVSDLITRYSPP